MTNETTTEEADAAVAEEQTVSLPDRADGSSSQSSARNVIETRGMSIYYGDFLAVADISLDFAKNEISALIGPSGCGKSTVLRSLNRMNDLIIVARTEGEVHYHGEKACHDGTDPR